MKQLLLLPDQIFG